MKQLLTSFFLLLTFGLTAQMNSSIDILIGGGGTYRQLKGESNNVDIRDDLEVSKFNVNLGFNYNRKIRNRVHFKTGLRYLSLGYKTRDQFLDFQGLPATPIQFTYDYQFVEVPLNLRIVSSEVDNVNRFFEIGLAPMFLFGSRKVEFQNGVENISTRQPLENFNLIHYALNAAAGMNCYISGETAVFIQFQFRYDFTNLVNIADLKENLYSYGVEVGIRRGLGKSKN